MADGIHCAICDWTETAHDFPVDYPMCNHKFVPKRHLSVVSNQDKMEPATMHTVIVPDPYEGWSEDRLRDRIKELSSALMSWQLIAANMGTIPAALDMLTTENRQKVIRMMEAYTD